MILLQSSSTRKPQNDSEEGKNYRLLFLKHPFTSHVEYLSLKSSKATIFKH